MEKKEKNPKDLGTKFNRCLLLSNQIAQLKRKVATEICYGRSHLFKLAS